MTHCNKTERPPQRFFWIFLKGRLYCFSVNKEVHSSSKKNSLLRNKINSNILRKKIQQENESRITLSFYRYVDIVNPKDLRDELFIEWSELGVCGRIYIAEEGINAQLNIPLHHFEAFKKTLQKREILKDMPLKIAVEDGFSFYKLTIKVKKNIVADGLAKGTYDTSNVGNHLTPEEFNKALEDAKSIIVDVRNHYESRIGHFEGALLPDADTFRDELPLLQNMLKGKEENKILLYCTGGIRCEKASSYLKHAGFKDVNQLYGGIIHYAHEIKAKGLVSKFKGRNFVFDDRLAERITQDILTECDQCCTRADSYTNCANELCNLLFIQCGSCTEKYEGCCSENCKEIKNLPKSEKQKRAQGMKKSYELYKSRLRAKLKN